MRIGDWISDVCSSDLRRHLAGRRQHAAVAERGQRRAGVEQPRRLQLLDTREGVEGFQAEVVEEGLGGAPGDRAARRLAARKSGVQGKDVSVRVDLGGRGTIKNNEIIAKRYRIESKIVTL